MGRAIDLFVTYRFIKLLVTPFEKTEAFKLGIIDKDGNRIMPPPKAGVRQMKPEPLRTTEERSAYTVLHKLVFNIKKYLQRCRDLELSWEHMPLHYFFSKIPSKNQSMIQISLKRNS